MLALRGHFSEGLLSREKLQNGLAIWQHRQRKLGVPRSLPQPANPLHLFQPMGSNRRGWILGLIRCLTFGRESTYVDTVVAHQYTQAYSLSYTFMARRHAHVLISTLMKCHEMPAGQLEALWQGQGGNSELEQGGIQPNDC